MAADRGVPALPGDDDRPDQLPGLIRQVARVRSASTHAHQRTAFPAGREALKPDNPPSSTTRPTDTRRTPSHKLSKTKLRAISAPRLRGLLGLRTVTTVDCVIGPALAGCSEKSGAACRFTESAPRSRGLLGRRKLERAPRPIGPALAGVVPLCSRSASVWERRPPGDVPCCRRERWLVSSCRRSWEGFRSLRAFEVRLVLLASCGRLWACVRLAVSVPTAWGLRAVRGRPRALPRPAQRRPGRRRNSGPGPQRVPGLRLASAHAARVRCPAGGRVAEEGEGLFGGGVGGGGADDERLVW